MSERQIFKTLTKKIMKTQLGVFALAFVLIIASACNDDEGTPAQDFTSDDAAEEVAATLSTDVADMAFYTDILAEDAENGRTSDGRLAACGVSYDTTINRQFTGEYISFNYTLEFGYQLSCTQQGVPNTLIYDFASDGERSGRRLMADGLSDGSLTTSGFEFSASNYTVNGTFDNVRTVTQKLGGQRTFTSQTSATLTNMLVNKASKKISGGSASMVVSGVGSGGGSYNYVVEVVFNGDGTATVTIGGSIYIITTTTGEIEKQS
jgi:hypothetical protein